MAIQEAGLALALNPQEFAYFTQQVFRGLTITERAEGYNIILRGYDKKGEPVYAMLAAVDPVEGLLKLLNALSDRGGESLWRTDKYAR